MTSTLSPAISALIAKHAEQAKGDRANRWGRYEDFKAALWSIVDSNDEFEMACRVYVDAVKL